MPFPLARIAAERPEDDREQESRENQGVAGLRRHRDGPIEARFANLEYGRFEEDER